MGTGLSAINRELNRVPRRAEQRQAAQLRDTFEDSGVAAALEAIDHQALYGRRGTGKTHALRYLESRVSTSQDAGVYIDLRTIGSPDGLFTDQAPPTERAARLLVDLLGQVHDALLAIAVGDEDLIGDSGFVRKLDALARAITTVRVEGDVETQREGETNAAEQRGSGIGLAVGSQPSIRMQSSSSESNERRELQRETRRGTERLSLNFSDVARALRELSEALSARRLWLLLDEWSSVPTDVQPYLGEFVVRCVLPLPSLTVKIAAIEQQTNFRMQLDDGHMIGIELGADIAANVDLDDFMVFEDNEVRAREFFRGLFFKHLTSGVSEDEQVAGLNGPADLVRLGFTDRRAFDELVRAAEGVPRDAINIAAKAALRSGSDRISVPSIREAARGWFQTDKEAALRGSAEAPRLLNWIIDKVIRGKRARGFLVNQKDARADLLLALFDARVLHLVRRGYSAQDEPGERYDVWVIDYGAYVDLMQTTYAPQGVLPTETDEYVDVPTQDLRAIRRAVLDLGEFEGAG